jgi:hypothetical protein
MPGFPADGPPPHFSVHPLDFELICAAPGYVVTIFGMPVSTSPDAPRIDFAP